MIDLSYKINQVHQNILNESKIMNEKKEIKKNNNEDNKLNKNIQNKMTIIYDIENNKENIWWLFCWK